MQRGSGGPISVKASNKKANYLAKVRMRIVINGWLVGVLSLVWCSQVHHCGFSSRRPGFESRHEH